MIAKIIGSDFYRIRKSKLFYGVVILSTLIAVALTMANRQDIRLGISIFGNLTSFKSVNDIISLGVTYQKGLGIIVAVFVSVFIGHEYQWNTWQHKWLISKTRVGMYLSKMIISVIASVSVFLLFELVVLVFSGQAGNLISGSYLKTLICGSAVYAALGAMLCVISILCRNSTFSVITSLGYVLCGEMVYTLAQNIGGLSNTAGGIILWLGNHTIYGISSDICTMPMTSGDVVSIIINACCIICLSAAIGILGFQRYEL